MSLEFLIKKKLVVFFALFVASLFVLLIVVNKNLRLNEKLIISNSTHQVFSRVFSESIKTNDIPEIAMQIKRSKTDVLEFFIYEINSDQLILSDYTEYEIYKKISHQYDRCMNKIIQINVSGKKMDIYCSFLMSSDLKKNFIFFQMSKHDALGGVLFLTIGLLLSIFFILILWVKLTNILGLNIFKPIANLENYVEKRLNTISNQKLIQNYKHETQNEIARFKSMFDMLLDKAISQVKLQQQNSILDVKVKLASQVAHDIRSPLAALEMVTRDLGDVEEDRRLIIRGAVTRIKDIANDLVKKNGDQKSNFLNSSKSEVQLVAALLDEMMTEKRLQYRSRPGVELELLLNPSSYAAFAEIQSTEFKRVISNLVNNSVESIANEGSVKISLETKNKQLEIKVTDTGKGIPEHVLPKLMQRGETHGKSGGSGLGLYHARQSIESWGGQLEISSKENQGTTIKIEIPKCQVPDWFLSELRLEKNAQVMIIDDDQSIHQIWDKKFLPFNQAIQVLHFYEPEELENWLSQNPLSPKAIFLCDYEFLQKQTNGIELIKKLKIESQSVLVSSRYEDEQLRANCKAIRLKMIPKAMVEFVPVFMRS